MTKKELHINHRLLFGIIPILLCVLAYYQILQVGFAYVDDSWMLLDETLVQTPFSWEMAKDIFTRINNLQYSPMNTLYYAILYQIDGYNAYYYHLGSFLLHLANGMILYKLLVLLFTCFSLKNEQLYAYLIVLIWLIHPFNVETVVWISASKIPLFSFFYLLSFYFFIKAYKKQGVYTIYYLFSILSFILSFLSKEQAVTLPLILVAFILTEQMKEKAINLRRMTLLSTPYILLAIAFIYISLYSLHFEGGSHPFDQYPFEKRIFFSFYSIGFYIFNSFLPIELHYHYSFPIKPDENVPTILYIIAISLVFTLFLLHATLRKTRTYALYLFLFIFFMANLSLCIHIISLPRASIVADRYMYLPLIAAVSMPVIYIGKRVESGYFKQLLHQYTLFFIGVAFFIGFVICSHNLVLDWKSRELTHHENNT